MPKVIIKRSSYDSEELRSQIFDILDLFCKKLIEKDSHVIIKPNLLISASPGMAVLTHPSIVRHVAEYVISKGAKPQISDSQAMGSFEKILKESGIRETLKDLDVEFKEFKKSATVDIGMPFGKIEIAEDVLKADVVINLPKLKTHSQMLLTLGVKNLFGCIVGYRKPEWHMRMGVDREMFAKLLVHIYKKIGPTVTIVDGILGMEGDGPGKGGIPRHLGVLIGSNKAVAADIIISRMLGIEPDIVLTNKVAKQMALIKEPIEVNGTMPHVENFRFPLITPLVYGPKRFHGLIRKHLLQRPTIDHSLCKACGKCIEFCPAGAITQSGEKLNFDYNKCIRCYCCLEVCPHGAIHSVLTFSGKVLNKLIH